VKLGLLVDKANWSEVEPGVEVKVGRHPERGTNEQSVLCRSSTRREKVLAMIELARKRLHAQLHKTHASLQKHPASDPGRIERRIGRWLGRYPAAEQLIEATVQRNARGQACLLSITKRTDRNAWAELAHGAYLVRTNCPEKDPAKLWRQ
jgi:hypothetical protein